MSGFESIDIREAENGYTVCVYEKAKKKDPSEMSDDEIKVELAVPSRRKEFVAKTGGELKKILDKYLPVEGSTMGYEEGDDEE